METKFTKGEWRIANEWHSSIDEATYIPICSSENNRGWIAEAKGSHVNKGLTIEEKIANANLISAAPDLLYALDSILKRYEMYCPDEYYKDDAVAEAEDVIKKALGESDSE